MLLCYRHPEFESWLEDLPHTFVGAVRLFAKLSHHNYILKGKKQKLFALLELSESWLRIILKLTFLGKKLHGVALGEKLWSSYSKTSTLALTSGHDKNWSATKQTNRPQATIDNHWNIAHIIIVNILLLNVIHSDYFNNQDCKFTSLSCEKFSKMNFNKSHWNATS